MSQNEAPRGGLFPHWVLEVPVYLVCGFFMSIGLGVSGMSNPINALGFFSVNSAKISWNPSLGFVFASALGTHAILYYIISALLSKPLLCNNFHQNTKHSLDIRLVCIKSPQYAFP